MVDVNGRRTPRLELAFRAQILYIPIVSGAALRLNAAASLRQVLRERYHANADSADLSAMSAGATFSMRLNSAGFGGRPESAL